ncbi:MAG: iron(III) transport system substrate-binding protein [Alphaproteobacteria bacterium]|jgi:iron(III) transport system substrate-binding protein|nr:iron(III) transport system substrate-binding protein [Alphaproteobacteria bacterium]
MDRHRIFVLAAALALAAAAPASAADQALIDAARKEGQFTWYTTQILTQFGRPAADAFTRKYGIRVNIVRGDSVELAVRLLNEGKAGRMQADAFDGTATSTAIKKEGLVLKWLPDGAKRLPKEYVDSEGFWVATNIYIQTPAYNTNLVPRGTQPQTWQDLLDPKWKGKLAWAGHATTSGAPGFVGLVLAELGEDKGMAYLRELARQNIVPLGGSARSVTDQAIAGEYPIVLQIFNHQPVISAMRGAPVDWIAMNPAMGILCVAAVTKDAPRPNAAKLFVDFLVSEEGQQLFRKEYYIPVDPDIAPLDPRIRPDGKIFRGKFFTPEEVDAAMPRWQAVFKDTFR